MGAVPATRPRPRTRPRPKPVMPRPAAPPRSRPARHTPAAGFAMLPVTAVGRTAGALGGIADSGLVGWLTRGRAWIALLGVLLGGIVALNVYGLSLSAQTSTTQTKVDQFERENSVLAGRVDRRSSSLRIQEVASALGLAAPAPDLIRYLKPGAEDGKAAGERIADGSIGSSAEIPLVPVDPAALPATDPTVIPVADPAATVPIEPAPIESTTAPPPDPATTAPPADPAYTAPVEGGGVPIP